MTFEETMDVYVTNHAKERISKRLGITLEDLIPKEEMVLYEDKFDNTKFYLNHDNGFTVFKRVAKDRLLVITTVIDGKIDNRASYKVSKTRLFV